MNITNTENLVDQCYYWITIVDEITIGQWNKFKNAGWFMICGCDEPFKFHEVTNISPVCILRH